MMDGSLNRSNWPFYSLLSKVFVLARPEYNTTLLLPFLWKCAGLYLQVDIGVLNHLSTYFQFDSESVNLNIGLSKLHRVSALFFMAQHSWETKSRLSTIILDLPIVNVTSTIYNAIYDHCLYIKLSTTCKGTAKSQLIDTSLIWCLTTVWPSLDLWAVSHVNWSTSYCSPYCVMCWAKGSNANHTELIT